MSSEDRNKEGQGMASMALIPVNIIVIGGTASGIVAGIWHFAGIAAAVGAGIVALLVIATVFSFGIGIFRTVFTGSRLVPGVMWCSAPEHMKAFWTRTPLPKEECQQGTFFVDAELIDRAERGDVSWLRDLGLKEMHLPVPSLVAHLAQVFRQMTRYKWIGAVLGPVRIAIFVVAFSVVVNMVSALLLSLGVSVDPTTRLIVPSLEMFSLGGTELVTAIAVIVLFWCLWEKRSWPEMGVGFRQPWVGYLLVGTFVAAILVIMIYVVGLLKGWVEFKGVEAVDPLRIVGVLALLFVMASAEELLFRGYILQSLERSSGAVVGVGLSSLLYALLHLGNPDADLLAFIGILAHGIFLCTILLMTRSLWLPVGFHWAWNVLLGVIFGLPVSGYSFERILRSELVGAHWFYSPSGFGPEAGVLAILCLFVMGVGLLGWSLTKMQQAVG